jgi:hypothetical protein
VLIQLDESAVLEAGGLKSECLASRTGTNLDAG